MGTKSKISKQKWEPEYGLDNTYCFEERVAHITHMLQERYGDIVRATPLRMELHMTEKEFRQFIDRAYLFRKTVCMGTYKVEDVAHAVAAYL